MRELDDAEVGLGEDCEEVLADVGNNADLHAANQESIDLINEACYCYCYLLLLLLLLLGTSILFYSILSLQLLLLLLLCS